MTQMTMGGAGMQDAEGGRMEFLPRQSLPSSGEKRMAAGSKKGVWCAREGKLMGAGRKTRL